MPGLLGELFFRITGPADVIAAGVGATNIALPLDDSGAKARYVLVQDDDGTNSTHARLGTSAPTALVTDMAIPLFTYPMLLNVLGYSHIGVIKAAGASTIYVTPVEPA